MGKSEQGMSRDRYLLVPRNLCFLFRDNHVLLLKGAAIKRLWAGKYNGVGGHIKRGEDILTSARREIYEETGLKPERLWLCGVITVDTGEDVGIGIFVFKGESKMGSTTESEEGQLEWISMDTLDNNPLVEDLFILLPKIAEMQVGDVPFAAQYSYDNEDKLVIDFSQEILSQKKLKE